MTDGELITAEYELCMFHIREFRNIYTYVVKQQMHTHKISFTIH